MRSLMIFLLMSLVIISEGQEKAVQPRAQGKGHKDTQGLVMEVAPTASDAVVPISYWIDHSAPGQQDLAVASGVVGTGFLVDRQGDFVTAAHVVKIKEIGPAERRVKVRLTAIIRQRSGDGSGVSFTVLEVDEGHDVALCHIDSFRVFPPADSPTAKSQAQHLSEKGALSIEDVAHPFASLAISKSTPRVGHFVLVSGFPLGSWTPAIQFGLVSAVRTIYPPETPVAGVPKDRGQLLQISVSANHGNSGGPVIDLASGQVVGVILQIVPAPLAVGGQQLYDSGTFAMSGIMLAAPASWVESLLTKHNIKSQGVKTGNLVIW